MTDKPNAADRRIAYLTESDDDRPGARALAYILADSGEYGTYAPVIRTWDHPNIDGASILSERYAFLTHGDNEASDGWKDGFERRVPEDVDAAEFCKMLGRAYLAAAHRLDPDAPDDIDPQEFDLLTEGDR